MRFDTGINELNIYLIKKLIRICNFLVGKLRIKASIIRKNCSLVEIWVKDNNTQVLWRLDRTLPLIEAMGYFIEEVRKSKIRGLNKSFILVSLRDDVVISTYKYEDSKLDESSHCRAYHGNCFR